jgi:hypothetical protein
MRIPQLKKSLFILCAVLSASSAATAKTTMLRVTVADISIEGESFARVGLNAAVIKDRPACHDEDFSSHYAWDISSNKGRAMLSIIQAAQLSGKKLLLIGSDTCTATGENTIETLTAVSIYTN